MSRLLSKRGPTRLLAYACPAALSSDTLTRFISAEPAPILCAVPAQSQSIQKYATTTKSASEATGEPRIQRTTTKLPVTRDVAESILELLLGESPNTSKDDIDAAIYQNNKHAAPSAIRKLAAHILQRSRSPDRDSVSGRLYALAYRRGDDDAGYSWATMIYEGLIHRGKSVEDRLDEALTLYAKLARRGHPQALFGMGRILLEQVRLAPSTISTRFPRIQQLWERAGRNGMPDAWYELGRVFQDEQLEIFDMQQAQHCFEQGARAGSISCSYALGVLHGTRSDKLIAQGNTKEAHHAILLSNRYFLQAAQRGHAPSLYNMGLRYLFVNDAQSTLSEEQQREAHTKRWGVAPDDRSAREWFAAASKKVCQATDSDFLPAIMNYGRMVLERRGVATANRHASSSDSELADAETIYRNALGLIKAMQNQNLAQASHSKSNTPATHSDSAVLNHMMQEAQHSLNRIAKLRESDSSHSSDSKSNGPQSQSPSSMCTIA